MCVFVIFRSLYLNIPGLLIVNVLASLVGLVVYTYYAEIGCDPLKEGYISNANQVRHVDRHQGSNMPLPHSIR